MKYQFLRCVLRATGCALAALAFGSACAQKIDDVPPAVQNNVPPNFMFMIDNSGSMSNIVPAAPYSPAATYLASCTSNVVPAGTSVDIKIVSGVPRFTYGGVTYTHSSFAGRNDTPRCFDNNATYGGRLVGDTASGSNRVPGGYLDTDYSGHFLNWYFGNYGGPVAGWVDRKLLTAGTGSVDMRIEIARRSAKAIIDGLPLTAPGGRAAVRLGLSTYRSGGGALRIAMQDLTSTSRDALKASIDQLTPSGNTPLATTFADIGRYLATGYNGNVATARDAAVNIDTLLKIDGTDNARRNACLSNTPVACTGPSTLAQQPIQYWCQRSAIVAMTDGRPQGDRGFDNNTFVRDYDGDCTGVNSANCVNNGDIASWDRKRNRTYESIGSDYMDDVAKLLFDVDWRPDLAKPKPVPPATAAKNNIRTYVIGFADPTVQNDPLLNNTARQGGGLFLTATDEATLNDAFRSALADALAKDAAAAAVAVTSPQITSDTIGYASSYSSGNWVGDLVAYSVDPSNGLQSGPVVWHARDKLQDQNTNGTRRIASFDGTRGVPFTRASGSAFRLAASTLLDPVIDYTRGSRAGEGTTFRARQFVLGDIINAEAVAVSYASGLKVVYQAANDGMLHAFDGRVVAPTQGSDTRGQELWAYVPALVHPKLAGRADPLFEHEYLLDATPEVADITGAGAIAKILVGGLAKGGAGYYALDITSGTAADETQAAAKVLWEVRPANMGYSFGTPLIVNTAAGWKVVVASGYGNDTAAGGLGGDGRGRVWVLNPATGAVDKVFVTPAGFGSATGALGLAHLAKPSNVPANAVTRFVYGGDLQGNVWRVDLDALTGSALVRVAAVTAPNGSAQPITVPPVVAPVVGATSSFWVYFGTGQYLSTDDVPGTGTPNASASQVQSVYGIVDDTSVAAPSLPNLRGNNGSTCPANGGNGALVCQQFTANAAGDPPFNLTHNPVNLSRNKGWYVDLPRTGQRVTGQAALSTGGTLVVVVNLPTNATCDPGGSSSLLQLDAGSGGAVAKEYGGTDYYAAYYDLAAALSSKARLESGNGGLYGVTRDYAGGTSSTGIHEPKGKPVFRRIYMRPLN